MGFYYSPSLPELSEQKHHNLRMKRVYHRKKVSHMIANGQHYDFKIANAGLCLASPVRGSL